MPRMKLRIDFFFKTLLLFSVVLASFAYGMASVQYKIFPYSTVRDAKNALVALVEVFRDSGSRKTSALTKPTVREFAEVQSDELILIKGWDSLDDGRARFTPHGAFDLPEMREDAPPRESIEVRTFAIIE